MSTNRRVRAWGSRSGLSGLLVLIFAAVLPTPVSSQERPQPQLDRRAGRYLTHMPHRSWIVERSQTGTPSQQSAASTLERSPLTFNPSTYLVGPTISPTTTVPEAEEEIAISPQNSSVMLAAISDFVEASTPRSTPSAPTMAIAGRRVTSRSIRP